MGAMPRRPLYVTLALSTACAAPAYRLQPLATVGLVPLAAQNAPAPSPPPGPAPLDIEPLWSFHAGAPLQASAGAANGTVAVGSSDGYLHTLRDDGAYRWSYTLKGAIVAPPMIDVRGTVFAVTAARRLYALSPQGTLAFSMALSGRPLAPLRWSSDGALLVSTSEGVAYAITTSGAMRTAMVLHERLSSPPLPLESGKWLVGSERGALLEIDGWKSRRDKLSDQPITALVSGSGKAYFALAGGRVFGAGGAENERFSQLGCAGEKATVVSDDGRVARVSAAGTRLLARLRGPASAAPACARDGRVFVPMASGELVVVRPDGTVRRYAVGRAMLFTPLVDEALGRVLVSAADGRTWALSLGAL